MSHVYPVGVAATAPVAPAFAVPAPATPVTVALPVAATLPKLSAVYQEEHIHYGTMQQQQWECLSCGACPLAF